MAAVALADARATTRTPTRAVSALQSPAAEAAPPDTGRSEVAGPAGARAYAELAALYREHPQEPPFSAALESLSSGSVSAAGEAAEYLLALYRQAIADETNGRAVWQQTPYWGGGHQSQAREFRKNLAQEIGLQAGGARAVPIVAWGLEHEPLADLQAALAGALPRLPLPEAGPLLVRLLSQPHPHATVVKAALGALDRAGTRDLREALVSRCGDYRASIRDSACAIARRRGIVTVPLFVPRNAFDTELDRVLREVAERVKPRIPRGARWCRIARTTETSRADTLHGWLVSENTTAIRFVGPSGEELELFRSRIRIASETLGGHARTLVRMRAAGPEQLSRRGTLTAQFEPKGISLVEANVAAWCYLRGERTIAAALLFPRLDEIPRLTDFESAVRGLAGDQAHLSMLEAFSYHRDYAAAIAWGDHLAKPVFDGYVYQSRGREVADQLRARQADFGAFALPDSMSWTSLQRQRTREQQITFLCERLRLVNSFQWGQPGGVNLGAPQHAGASHLTRAFDHVTNRSPKVINPLSELDRLRLRLDDVPALFPFLADRNFLPTFEFWRDFHPDRRLFRVCEVVQETINEVARQPLVDAEHYSGLTAVERTRYRDRVLDWCRAHTGRSDVDLDLETLGSTTVQNVFWFTADRLAKNGDPRAAPIILRRMDEFPGIRQYMIRSLRVLRAAEAVPRARHWVVHAYDGVNWADPMDRFKRDEIRFESALILLQHAAPGTHEGWPELRDLLERDRERYWRWQAAGPLLDTGDREALAWLCERVGGGEYSFGQFEHRGVYRDLVRSGCEPLMRSMVRFLSSDSVVFRTPANAKVPGTYLIGDRVVAIVGPLSPDSTVHVGAADDEGRAVQRDKVHAWLAGRLKATGSR